MPLQWCFWQLLMGEMYRNRLEGRRKKNLQQAIKCFQRALRSYESLEHPQARRNWIQIQMVCGRTYADLGRLVEQSQTLYAKAQECYRCAESVLKDESAPFLQACMQQDLSYTYLLRTDGERQANLQQVLVRGQSALHQFTRSHYPSAWADVHVSMAEAYQQATSYADLCELYSGQTAMQEQAIRHIDAALQVYTPSSHPLEWARAQYVLGVIYSDRFVGKRSENLGRAMDCLEAAQRVFRPGFSSLEWRAIQRHLMILQRYQHFSRLRRS
jgi:tetratricopeptide (TPR) repeat protein